MHISDRFRSRPAVSAPGLVVPLHYVHEDDAFPIPSGPGRVHLVGYVHVMQVAPERSP